MSSMIIHCLTMTVSCTKSTWKATLRVDRHFNSSDKAPQLSSRLLQTVSNWLGGVFVELVDFLFSFFGPLYQTRTHFQKCFARFLVCCLGILLPRLDLSAHDRNRDEAADATPKLVINGVDHARNGLFEMDGSVDRIAQSVYRGSGSERLTKIQEQRK